MSRVFVLFGSNIEPRRNFARAVRLLGAHFPVVGVSGAFLTAPVGDTAQDDFVNAAIELRSDDTPDRIQVVLHEIESLMGRRRDPERPLGPRCVDLDLVFVDDTVGTFGFLELPAPVLAVESFAAVPVAALAGGLVHPLLGVSLAELARKLAAAAPRPPVEIPWEAAP